MSNSESVVIDPRSLKQRSPEFTAETNGIMTGALVVAKTIAATLISLDEVAEADKREALLNLAYAAAERLDSAMRERSYDQTVGTWAFHRFLRVVTYGEAGNEDIAG